jgi:uncharacterized repeat protein (TIGR03803 family)
MIGGAMCHEGSWLFTLPSGKLALDAAGNLYGTTERGGLGDGTVYKLTYGGSVWALDTLYNFQGSTDREMPSGGVVVGLDEATDSGWWTWL